MPTRQDWENFKRAFEDLGAVVRRRQTKLDARYYPEGSGPLASGASVAGVKGEWEVMPRGSDDAENFQRLARRAAVAAGYPDCQEGWVYWLDAIRDADLKKPKGADWEFGTMDGPRLESSTVVHDVLFEDICQQSAHYCMLLAAGTVTPPPVDALAGKENGRDPKRVVCSWPDVEIRLVSEHRVQFLVKGQPLESPNYAEMGCENRKNGKPTLAWVALQILGQFGGEYQKPPPSPKRNALEKHMQALRKILRRRLERLGFDIPPDSDPLPCEQGTFRARFKIGTGASYSG